MYSVAELGTILNAIDGMQFAHFAFSGKPSGDYGLYGEDIGYTFNADNATAESVTEVMIDYFTRTDDGTPKRKIEAALTAAKIPFSVDAIQFENDTGFIHYSWVVVCNG